MPCRDPHEVHGYDITGVPSYQSLVDFNAARTLIWNLLVAP